MIRQIYSVGEEEEGMTVYAGLDVSMDETPICIRDESGIFWEGKVASSQIGLYSIRTIKGQD